MTFTKDQVAAIKRHVYTGLGGVAAGGTAVAVAFGAMAQEDAEKIIAAAQQLGEGIGALMTAAGLIVGAFSAMRAAFSASPAEQVRKVEQQVPGVVVVPVTAGGQATIKAGTGIVKPIESPSNGEQS